MGLAQQIAFSSLLAFFPAVVFLVGLLDLVDAYPTLKDFLAPIAPGDVLETVDTLQAETSTARRRWPSSSGSRAPPGRRAAR